MRQILKITYLLIIMCFAISLSGEAQPVKKQTWKEALMAARLREVKLALKLDDQTLERFKPLYISYDKDISRINTERQKTLMKADIDTLSNAAAEEMMAAQIRTARTIIDIQEQYAKEFRAVLTPQQILRFFRAEKEIRRKALVEYRKRFPPKPKTPAKPQPPIK